MGVERDLFRWIPLVLQGQGDQVPDDWTQWRWAKDFRNWERGGSPNHAILANVLRLYLNDEGAGAWWNAFFHRELHHAFFQWNELLSRMKSPWHVVGVACAHAWATSRRRDANLAHAARQYLRRFWALAALTAVPHPSAQQVRRGRPMRRGPHLVTAGPRSPATVWARNQSDDLVSFALRWPGWSTRYRRNWSLETVRLLGSDLGLGESDRESLRTFVASGNPELLSPLLTMIGSNCRVRGRYTILRTAGGLMTWFEGLHNRHSRPAYAARHTYADRSTTFLAPDLRGPRGGARTRSFPPHEVKRQPEGLDVRCADWSGSMPFPPGKVIHEVVLERDALPQVFVP